MRITEVDQLLQRWEARSVYVDVPVGEESPDWRGYQGTHIIEAGATELTHVFRRNGYDLSRRYPWAGFIAYFDRAV
jgi:hypothetical protein